MGVAVGFDAGQLRVTPGGEATAEIRVRNKGDVVDRFDLDVLGDAKSWIRVEPASMNLLPGDEQVARVILTPPRSSAVAAGETTFAVRVLSHEDTEGSVIHESQVVVEPFVQIAADLIPRTSRGSWRGRHELAVDNTGNLPTMVELRPSDPDAMLQFRLERSALDTEPGTASFVGLQARPVKRFLRGQNKTLPFQVAVLPEGDEPITVSGSMLQEAMLPKWLVVAAVAVAAGVAALLIFWYTLVKPEVQTTARQAAKQETQQLAAGVSAAQAKAAEASKSADEAKAAAGVGGAGGGAQDGAATQTAEPRGPAEAAFAPSATDLRITTSAAPGQPGTFTTFKNDPPENKLYWISDLVLQNPRGDSGILQVRRGNDVLFEVGLDNFRDLDYHFIQPVRFSHQQAVVVAVDGRNPADPCTPSVYFTGQILPEPSSPPPTPTG